MADVRELLDDFAAGKVTLGAVVADFAKRPWVADEPPAETFEEAARREQEDIGPASANSWAAVESAYVAGKLTYHQYAVLYAAVTGDGSAVPRSPS